MSARGTDPARAGRPQTVPDTNAGGPFGSPEAASVEVRDVRTQEEFAACVGLQEETWGRQFSERVPAAILKVAQRIGGVTAGAFDPAGRLLGFVFGMTGVERGELVHWSDMLAVRPEARDHGIGRRLKLHQRETLRRIGVVRIYWTFDPLVARNAHFNFNRLGVRVTEYVRDMYGSDTDSPLHRGLGTDRFVVAWAIADDADGQPSPRDVLARFPAAADAPVAGSSVLDSGLGHDAAPLLRVEIPADIHAVQVTSPERAAAWRADTRSAFERFLARGYSVAGFYRDSATDRCFYVLRPAAADHR